MKRCDASLDQESLELLYGPVHEEYEPELEPPAKPQYKRHSARRQRKLQRANLQSNESASDRLKLRLAHMSTDMRSVMLPASVELQERSQDQVLDIAHSLAELAISEA